MEDSESVVVSVMTLRSRSSLDPASLQAHDTALRIVVQPRHRRAVRRLEHGYSSWINAVCLTERLCPIQLRDFGQDEMRMRSCGVLGGSGHALVFFDAQLGSVIKTAHDLASPVLCMSISNPRRRSKLAPLLATGLRDGRVVLWDMQTASPLYETLAAIRHPAPVTAVHICEGARSLCAVATHVHADQVTPQCLVYNFDLGRCDAILQDHHAPHGGQITAVTTCFVPTLHSLLCTAGTDGVVHAYDVFGFAHLLALRDTLVMDANGELVTDPSRPCSGPDAAVPPPPSPSLPLSAAAASAAAAAVGEAVSEVQHGCIYGIACVPGQLPQRRTAGKAAQPGRPSLLVAACRDSLLRVFDLCSGQLVHRLFGHEKGSQVFCCAALSLRTPGAASGGQDGSVRLWDLWHGVQLACLRDPLLFHRDIVRSVAVSLSPRVCVVSGGYDSRLMLWDLTTATYGPSGGERGEAPLERGFGLGEEGAEGKEAREGREGGAVSRLHCPALARAFRCLTRRPTASLFSSSSSSARAPAPPSEQPTSSSSSNPAPTPSLPCPPCSTLALSSYDDWRRGYRREQAAYRKMTGVGAWAAEEDGGEEKGEGDWAEKEEKDEEEEGEERGDYRGSELAHSLHSMHSHDYDSASVASQGTELDGRLGSHLM